ncbi:hypothetical protein LCGC14_0141810 [marine sediment metagenome]|uniref:Uncharacterized protein n=1 Tax=marine sediment metagenome TaxID=412755 RepID=A0A0F9XIC3_9ZZZZ
MSDKGKQYKLFLGRFNQCVDYSPERKNRSIDPNANVFFCKSPDHTNGECVIRHGLRDFEAKKVAELLSRGMFEIPTFMIGRCSKYGTDHLLGMIELDVLARLKKTIDESDSDVSLKNILVQIKSCQIFDDYKLKARCPEESGKYALVEFGIAVVVPATKSELVSKEDWGKEKTK